ncbi:redoxin domain-containing protein [Poriferisphaera sp. WC338]|uniref:TlpA family protein disulfide reductase n=1 Tax=Poriferisphaera sp. WC338 TaxID=3425129 RepID=UPI003D816CBE
MSKQLAVAVAIIFCAMTMLAGAAIAGEKMPAEWFWGDANQRAEHDKLVGKKIPLWKLTDWMNGEVTKKSMKGKVVVVDFWATWCGPCIGAIPHNNEMAKKYADDGVVIVGICGSTSGQEKMEKIAKEKKIIYPLAKDSTFKMAPAWKVMWWPTYAIIDREGKIRAVGLMSNKVEDAIKFVLKEQPAVPDEDDNKKGE